LRHISREMPSLSEQIVVLQLSILSASQLLASPDSCHLGLFYGGSRNSIFKLLYIKIFKYL